MSAAFARSVPEPSPSTRSTHDASHTWQLRGVEFDEGVSVSRYECDSCDEVWFA
ncbi:MAG: hypothetical protein JWO76_3124 [Nocardioides sp.]|nr:hypothetical protein [Nocardioides sp.]